MLRRIAEHVKQQNWLAVVIEFLIVVVGVFLGLQAQEWNQQRTDRIKAGTYLERLSADFTAIDEDLQLCLSTYRDSVDAIKLISRVVADHGKSDPPGSEDSGSFENALIRMTAGRVPAGRSATFIEMLSTGDLSILDDAALRNALIAYDDGAQVSRETWRSLREVSVAYGRPVYEYIKLDVNLDERQMSSIREYDLDGMARDPAFQSMLSAFSGNKGNNYELCQAQLELARNVRRRVSRLL